MPACVRSPYVPLFAVGRHLLLLRTTVVDDATQNHPHGPQQIRVLGMTLQLWKGNICVWHVPRPVCPPSIGEPKCSAAVSTYALARLAWRRVGSIGCCRHACGKIGMSHA